MKALVLTLAVILLFNGLSISVCYGQRVKPSATNASDESTKIDTLIDKISHTKYILDSDRVYITAIDSIGKQLWRTNPRKDNGLEPYRTPKPIIWRFYFDHFSPDDFISKKGKRQKRKQGTLDKGEEVIWIVYNNTQAGIIDKRTGKFSLLFQL